MTGRKQRLDLPMVQQGTLGDLQAVILSWVYSRNFIIFRWEAWLFHLYPIYHGSMTNPFKTTLGIHKSLVKGIIHQCSWIRSFSTLISGRGSFMKGSLDGHEYEGSYYHFFIHFFGLIPVHRNPCQPITTMRLCISIEFYDSAAVMRSCGWSSCSSWSPCTKQ